MKTLYLVRHAEALGQGANVRDFDRPLNNRGETDASWMGKGLMRRQPQPEAIVSSPAIRAKMTVKILATTIDYSESVILYDERIYEADPEDLLSIILGLDNADDCVMLVGHNPALTQLVNALALSNITNMPTCSMAALQFPSDSWTDIGRVRGELREFDYPGKEAE